MFEYASISVHKLFGFFIFQNGLPLFIIYSNQTDVIQYIVF